MSGCSERPNLYSNSDHPFKGASRVSLVVKNLPANAGDMGSIPGVAIFPGGGQGNPLHRGAGGLEFTGCKESDTTEVT